MIVLIPIGNIDKAILEALKQPLEEVFEQRTRIGDSIALPRESWNQEFYGLPRDENLFRERALTEAVHELGHTYGLGHCPVSTCVMHFSNSLHDTDLKG